MVTFYYPWIPPMLGALKFITKLGSTQPVSWAVQGLSAPALCQDKVTVGQAPVKGPILRVRHLLLLCEAFDVLSVICKSIR